MESYARNAERLRWRAWPCPRCRGSVTPIDYLGARVRAGAGISVRTADHFTKEEVVALAAWIDSCPHNAESVVDLSKLDEGSEHAVYLDAGGSQVVKLTLPGRYGESYYLVHELVHQQDSWPGEYLLRMELWANLFGGAPLPIGMTNDGRIVSVQKFVEGSLPTQEQVDAFLRDAGLEPVKQSAWLWKKVFPGEKLEIWIGDARADNFVLTVAGMVPIDIRLWFMPNSSASP